jgi:hypothetical protein
MPPTKVVRSPAVSAEKTVISGNRRGRSAATSGIASARSAVVAISGACYRAFGFGSGEFGEKDSGPGLQFLEVLSGLAGQQFFEEFMQHETPLQPFAPEPEVQWPN